MVKLYHFHKRLNKTHPHGLEFIERVLILGHNITSKLCSVAALNPSHRILSIAVCTGNFSSNVFQLRFSEKKAMLSQAKLPTSTYLKAGMVVMVVSHIYIQNFSGHLEFCLRPRDNKTDHARKDNNILTIDPVVS